MIRQVTVVTGIPDKAFSPWADGSELVQLTATVPLRGPEVQTAVEQISCFATSSTVAVTLSVLQRHLDHFFQKL